MEESIAIEDLKKKTAVKTGQIISDLKVLLNMLEREFGFICEKLPWCAQEIKLTIDEANDLINFLIWNSENFHKPARSAPLVEIIEELNESVGASEELIKHGSSLEKIKEFNRDNYNLYEKIYDKISYAMVIIQNQDIIRQNLENISGCLELAQEKTEMLNRISRDSVLGFLVFLNKVTEIALALVENVKGHLNGLCRDLGVTLQEVNDLIIDYTEKGQICLMENDEEIPEPEWLAVIFHRIERYAEDRVQGETAKETMQAYNAIRHIHRLVSKTIHDMKQKLRIIFREMAETCERINNTDFNALNDHIYGQVADFKACALGFLNDFLHYYQVDSWDGDRESLKELLNRFTCLMERQTAQKIWGEEVVESGSGCDIVLF